MSMKWKNVAYLSSWGEKGYGIKGAWGEGKVYRLEIRKSIKILYSWSRKKQT